MEQQILLLVSLKGEQELQHHKAEQVYKQLKENMALSKSDSNLEILMFNLQLSLPIPVLLTLCFININSGDTI